MVYQANRGQAVLTSAEVFFSLRVMRLLNNIPAEFVSAPTMNIFKIRIDRYFIALGAI